MFVYFNRNFSRQQESNNGNLKGKVKSLSRVRLFAIPWTVAPQAPLSMDISRQEYWSGLPFPSPGDLPNPGIEPWSLKLQPDSLAFEPPGNDSISFVLFCMDFPSSILSESVLFSQYFLKTFTLCQIIGPI